MGVYLWLNGCALCIYSCLSCPFISKGSIFLDSVSFNGKCFLKSVFWTCTPFHYSLNNSVPENWSSPRFSPLGMCPRAHFLQVLRQSGPLKKTRTHAYFKRNGRLGSQPFPVESKEALVSILLTKMNPIMIWMLGKKNLDWRCKGFSPTFH